MRIAAVFIHGLGGDHLKTWGRFPELISNDGELASVIDLFFYDYPSEMFSVGGLFGLNKLPSIQDIAKALRADIEGICANHDKIILVCHSLGGVIARRLLVDVVNCGSDIEKFATVLLFASPYSGSSLAAVGRYISWKNIHLKQLCRDSDIIDSLNEDWLRVEMDNKVNTVYIAGLDDRIVSVRDATQYWRVHNYHVISGKGHLSIVKPEDHNDRAYVILKNYLNKLVEGGKLSIASAAMEFSGQLREEMLKVNKKIETLTGDQFNVIDRLIKSINQSTRTSINTFTHADGWIIEGCAGSGKTLVAIEISLRLALYGFSVLMLCSNKLLSDFIKKCTFSHDIDVHDYNGWIKTTIMCNVPHEMSVNEPTRDELRQALLAITSKGRRYDAIVIDEGQDFRDEWLATVESSIDSTGLRFFVAFLDPFQELHIRATWYKEKHNRLYLDKNCRNAGNIFDVVKRFNANTPNTSRLLIDSGYFLQSIVKQHDMKRSAVQAVQEAVNVFGVAGVIIVTSEICGLDSSIIANQKIKLPPEWRWQLPVTSALGRFHNDAVRLLTQYNRISMFVDSIGVDGETLDGSLGRYERLIKYGKMMLDRKCLKYVRQHGGRLHLYSPVNFERDVRWAKKIREMYGDINVDLIGLARLRGLKLPELSDSPFPTEDDIRNVREFTDRFSEYFIEYDEFLALPVQMKWKCRPDNKNILEIVGYIERRTGNVMINECIRFFGTGYWHTSLPAQKEIELVPRSLLNDSDGQMPIYDIQSVKGLEGDAVIFIVYGAQNDLDKVLYLGISRARFYMHLVIDDATHVQVQQLDKDSKSGGFKNWRADGRRV